MRALVVDDSTMVVRRVSDTLQAMGVTATTAKDGEEAYAAFLEGHYDVVVADIIMPICDGIELTRKIRAINRRVPIVLLTSASDIDYVRQARDAGASAYLLKPFDEGLLRQRVEELLASSSLPETGSPLGLQEEAVGVTMTA
jgi:CheY-like chemotaxis protein